MGAVKSPLLLKMKTAKQIVEEINSKSPKISSPHFVDNYVNMNEVEEVATIDRDEHRWYVIGTKVFKIGEEFFGVRGPITLKSESFGYCDIQCDCDAFEMESIPSVTYRLKV